MRANPHPGRSCINYIRIHNEDAPKRGVFILSQGPVRGLCPPSALFDPVGSIGVVPLPGLSIVVGERLAPNRHLRVCLIPFKHYDNRSSYLEILAKEQADPVIERTYYGRVYRAAITVDPV